MTDITEYLGQGARLEGATVSISNMGERVISADIHLDGSVTPIFKRDNGDPWYLVFKGEKYILPDATPQMTKDNTSLQSTISLTFQHEAIHAMQQKFYCNLTTVESGGEIVGYVANTYDTSFAGNITMFIDLLNRNLTYAGITNVVIEAGASVPTSTTAVYSVKYSSIWEVLQQVYELYELNWKMEYSSSRSKYIITVLATPETASSHVFQYGYEGGLKKIERQVESNDIKNIILGRGAEKNLPYRYFKEVDEDNPTFRADPDAIPELENIYFDRLRDNNFREYVRGWAYGKGYEGHTLEEDERDDYWACELGYQDAVQGKNFNPVEYVKDDTSIAANGERWGAAEDNDDIYPTIADNSLDINNTVLAVSAITTDDVGKMAEYAEKITNFKGADLWVPYYEGFTPGGALTTKVVTWRFEYGGISTYANATCSLLFTTGLTPGKTDASANLTVYSTQAVLTNATTGETLDLNNFTYPYDPTVADTFVLELAVTFVIKNDSIGSTKGEGTLYISDVEVTNTKLLSEGWSPTFDIWVPNLFGDAIASGETAEQFATRVWKPILGDKDGGEAMVLFSTGLMSYSDDYEFRVTGVEYDTSIPAASGRPQSFWKFTLEKSDAEYEATGKYVPGVNNAPVAGDKFFFINVEFPHAVIVAAERALTATKTSEVLDKYKSINPTWAVELDKIRLQDSFEGESVKIISYLDAGKKMLVYDSRFPSGATLQTPLQLYIQSIEYKWESTSLIPEVSIVLSNQIDTEATTIELLQGEVSKIKTEYVSSEQLEETIDKVASARFLAKTPSPKTVSTSTSNSMDTSYIETSFVNKIHSDNFTAGGVGGSGWGIYKNAEGKSVIEADNIVVRNQFSIYEMVINQTKYQGGSSVSSMAAITCTRVEESSLDGADVYVCYFEQKGGSVANNFEVGDVAYCQRFSNPTTSEMTAKSYKRRVLAVTANSITLAKTGDVSGTGVPEKDDVIIQYGSYSNANRRFAVIRNVEGGAYDRMIEGLDSVSADGTEYYFAGKSTVEGDYAFRLGDSSNFLKYQKVDGEYKLLVSGSVAVGSAVVDLSELERLSSELGDPGSGGSGLVLAHQVAVYGDSEIKGGISGEYDEDLAGKSIAAWFGGPKADKQATPAPETYATSLFRFDGTGYFAGGNISWGTDGTVHLATSKIDLGGSATLNQLFQWVTELRSLFEKDETSIVGTTLIKAKYALYSTGEITAGGVGSGGGGGGGLISRCIKWADIPTAITTATATNEVANAYTTQQIYLNTIGKAMEVGDLLVASGEGEFDRLEKGTSGQVLTATTTGLKWGDAPSSDKFYEYTQSVASATWVITHNLDKYPSVTVVDSANTSVMGDVEYLDSNSLQVSFGAAFSGKAYLN